MTVKLLTQHHLEFLSLKGGCTGSSEFTQVLSKCHIVWNHMHILQISAGLLYLDERNWYVNSGGAVEGKLASFDTQQSIGYLAKGCAFSEWKIIGYYCTRIVACWRFSKLTFSKNSFRNTFKVSSSLNPDQPRPIIGPICLQRLSAEDKI